MDRVALQIRALNSYPCERCGDSSSFIRRVFCFHNRRSMRLCLTCFIKNIGDWPDNIFHLKYEGWVDLVQPDDGHLLYGLDMWEVFIVRLFLEI